MIRMRSFAKYVACTGDTVPNNDNDNNNNNNNNNNNEHLLNINKCSFSVLKLMAAQCRASENSLEAESGPLRCSLFNHAHCL
jgi:hypothetical protein